MTQSPQPKNTHLPQIEYQHGIHLFGLHQSAAKRTLLDSVRRVFRRRPDRDAKPVLGACPRTARCACGAAQITGGVLQPVLCDGRGLDLLCARHDRSVPPRGRLHRSHSQGRKACRCRRRPNSRSSPTCGPRRCWVSPFPRGWSPPQTTS